MTPPRPALTVFAVNRLERPLELDAVLRDLDELVVAEHRVLADPDIRASNTADHPDRVVPSAGPGGSVVAGRLTVTLPARSWNVVRLARARPPDRGDPISRLAPARS